MNIDVVCGLPVQRKGPAYTLVQLLQAMARYGDATRLFAPMNRWGSVPDDILVDAPRTGIFAIDRRLPYHRMRKPLKTWSERRLLGRNDPASRPLVYTWGDVSLDLTRTLHRRGNRVVREKFNCTQKCARDILMDAYGEVDARHLIKIRDEHIEKEIEELNLADAIFSPSPMVRRSLLEIGVAPDRIIDTSYGWNPERFHGDTRALPPHPGVTLLFVGSIRIRKGILTLLRAWEKANIRGRLVLVGAIEPFIEHLVAPLLARDDVVHVPFTPDVAGYFRSADWFIFPTLEEGGPQVTYEAAGCGLPALVTPMGAGAFTRDGNEGVVLDSNSPDDWARLIDSLPDRTEERDILARNAQRRATEFTYAQVGARRRESLLERFGGTTARIS